MLTLYFHIFPERELRSYLPCFDFLFAASRLNGQTNRLVRSVIIVDSRERRTRRTRSPAPELIGLGAGRRQVSGRYGGGGALTSASGLLSAFTCPLVLQSRLRLSCGPGPPLSVFDKLSRTLCISECQFVKYPK